MRGLAVLVAAIVAAVAVVLLISSRVWAEDAPASAIAGKVRGAEKGEPVPFVSVAFFREGGEKGPAGTPVGGVVTKADGSYRIPLAPGAYRVVVSHIAYRTLTESGVVVKTGQTTRLDLELAQAAIEQEAVNVVAEKIGSTDLAVLSRQRKAAVVSDGVSAELIKKTPDANAADVLRRVSGLSVVDDKYVFIRGVTDRYNVATLDGVKVSSTDTDSDKRSFAFDLVPGSLLSNTVVVKSATPDLPGDFSGGLVQVNTLDFPAARILKLSLSSGYDRAASGREIERSPGSGSDWRGSDDGIRAIPSGLSGDDLARALPNSWVTRSGKAPLNGSYGLSYGDRYTVGRHHLGVVGSMTYRQSFQRSEFTQSPSFMGVPFFDLKGSRSGYSVLWAGLLNLAYSPARDHQFSVRNNYVQNGKDQVSVSEGLPASGEYARRQTIQWDERTLSSTQVTGSHRLKKLGNLGIQWKAFRSSSEASEPDRKHVEFERSGDVWALKENYRTWSSLSERSLGTGADFTLPIGDGEVKAGFSAESRKRDYGIDAYATDPSYLSPANYGLLVLPLDEIFLPENYGPGKFKFAPLVRFTGEYDGKEEVRAWYGMVDRPFALLGQQFRAAGGARVERGVLAVNTVKAIDDPTPITARDEKTEVLPSLNFTYMPSDKANVRLAYGQSLNRPELREMANVLYYDFEREQNVIGNPDLRHALIRNYDARVEVFPGGDQVVAVSYFHKELTDAIEERLLPSPERFVRTWFNSDGANKGWEGEVRKSLGFLGERFSPFSVLSNYTRVHSAIRYEEKTTDSFGHARVAEKTRPMQGQAPWTWNVSLLCSSQRSGTSAQLLLNRAGRRLDAVGDTRNDDVYEEPRSQIDLAVTQKLSGRLEFKLSVKNVLDTDRVLTSGPERDVYSRESGDRTYALSFGASI
jgi:hypothetical protein